MPARQGRLDRRLAGQQPVERLVKLVVGDLTQAQDLAQAGGRRHRVQPFRRRQLRGRRDDPADDHRHDQIAWPIGLRSQQPVEADLADHAQHRCDMAMRQCADDLERLGARRHNHAALEQGAQSLDTLARPIG